jgi:hypothetical protein
MKLLVMQFPPISCHFISLRSKYSSQHPVLKHPQSVVVLSDLNENLNLLTNFHQILFRRTVVELFYPCRRTHRQTDGSDLIGALQAWEHA